MPTYPTPDWLPNINGQFPLIWFDFVNNNYWFNFAEQLISACIVTDTTAGNTPSTPVPSYQLNPTGLEILPGAPAIQLAAGAQTALNNVLSQGGATWIGRWLTNGATGTYTNLAALVPYETRPPTSVKEYSAIASNAAGAGKWDASLGAVASGSINSSVFPAGLFQVAYSALNKDHLSLSAMGAATQTEKINALGFFSTTAYAQVGRTFDGTAAGGAGPANVGVNGAGDLQFLAVFPWQPDNALPAFSNPNIFGPVVIGFSPILTLPNPVPLPCVPCCVTAAPCDCQPKG